ncbi:hypothetical protein [Alteromonas sp. C1M14]|uniref:hypothetical protein n=1 Tax=Alteromonas sp. C1M14 TaxID=2841567 RepID=UPI001C081D07|nr:hypothetical protein [Alteromonas sp. C1M14]MBU2979032.1 hypothetical protein [Alteromonas sp. C1M14]
MLTFLPNFGKMPVEANKNVSVILNNESFYEGPAIDFDWSGDKPTSVQGWREMQPGEVLHSEHRLPHRRGNSRLMKHNGGITA